MCAFIIFLHSLPFLSWYRKGLKSDCNSLLSIIVKSIAWYSLLIMVQPRFLCSAGPADAVLACALLYVHARHARPERALQEWQALQVPCPRSICARDRS